MWAHRRMLGIHHVQFLSYFPYVKAEAIRALERDVGWRSYGGKHCESIFTRFYQGCILPTKFGRDKRSIHFARLICSAQMAGKKQSPSCNEIPMILRRSRRIATSSSRNWGSPNRSLRRSCAHRSGRTTHTLPTNASHEPCSAHGITAVVCSADFVGQQHDAAKNPRGTGFEEKSGRCFDAGGRWESACDSSSPRDATVERPGWRN